MSSETRPWYGSGGQVRTRELEMKRRAEDLSLGESILKFRRAGLRFEQYCRESILKRLQEALQQRETALIRREEAAKRRELALQHKEDAVKRREEAVQRREETLQSREEISNHREEEEAKYQEELQHQ
ncbi:hypothetical protein Moror_5064 [Moniliophthora roreri MCA 2997]|uniref:Uncharacterized protein n=1 Tax=Moniliophthora roreri (strain MCA 2997) TaxID=1381753 RepID=V2X1I2_MONRO|nr:hypothetical protein Moror_5064 [Moniliophthora roreri MCA 2997]